MSTERALLRVFLVSPIIFMLGVAIAYVEDMVRGGVTYEMSEVRVIPKPYGWFRDDVPAKGCPR